MPQGPPGAPPFKAHRAAYREFMEGLWYAQEVFKNEGDGGIEGPRLACRAVARFVGARHVSPELAAPFLNILRAFDDLEGGGSPELFSKDVSARRRSRSSARKHSQLVAAALMQGLMDLNETYENAAAIVARAAATWSVFGDQDVTPLQCATGVTRVAEPMTADMNTSRG